ncbi:MAG: response regulator transcription factor [Verrucomicrobia bacterium]|nr:response regulator transcription factor [Verrucomicrobiota bacterium]MBU4247882.1 response regulator transcription factor [Verrucomicrobiota bacterium]MBU4292246.1 response regulator transcription factor [Verrucomicrobiota bacterium]MBU4427985.1 response regulator transcription factor [Verrucomicrobiota bacterium]MBU4498024.1 response regulator transcription factor [Verrucomicrobiota bacterium]
MAKEHIVIVEDEEDILELLRYHLTREGYSVTTVTNGEQALKTISQQMPALVLMDLMLPGLNGLELCRILKKDPQTTTIPIIMVTAKNEESDVVIGLELGADDYIMKPFSMKVLVARVHAVLRRRKQSVAATDEVIRIHDLVVNPGRHEVLIKGKPVEMTFSELRILHFLARRPGWVMTREQIVNAVRGEDYAVTDRAVDVQIVGLRKKLGARAEYIETVRGVGYRFKE